jgi:hypothetical protein
MMKRMNVPLRPPNAFLASILCLFPLWLVGCRGSDTAADRANASGLDEKTRGRVVLEVDGTEYTNQAFYADIRAAVGQQGVALEAPALSRLFDDFCDEKILLSKARSEGIVLTDDEKSAYLDGLRKAMGAASAGDFSAEETDILLERLLTDKHLARLTSGLSVGEEEIAAYYEAHKSDFLQPEKIQVSQILLDSEGKASTVRERLRGANEEDFRAAARKESAGPEAAKGGIMGVFSPGQLPQELESVILPLRPGEISRVVGSSYGFHIFRLDKRTDARLVTIEDASEGIRSRLLDEKGRRAVADHLEELKRTLEWRAYPSRLPFAYQRNDHP